MARKNKTGEIRSEECIELQLGMFAMCENSLMPILEVQEARLIAAGKELEQSFRAEKKRLHQALVEAHSKTGGKRPAGLYSKIQLFSKHRNGTLQIYWQDVHQTRGTGTPAYIYLRKTQPDGYDAKLLQARATYAADLVVVYEARAKVIRRLWRDLMEIKKKTRDALQRLPKDVPEQAIDADRKNAHIHRSQTDLGWHTPDA